MPDALIYADTVRSPELRHELPLVVPDAFLYAELDGRRHVVVSALERERVAALDPDVVLHPPEAFGFDDLLASGLAREDAELEVAVRACRELGVTRAAVPGTFPLELADRLRAAGISLEPARELFEARRRSKSAAELEGIRRAQAAAEAGMRAAAELLRAAEPDNGVLTVDGEPLTCERLRDTIEDAVADAGATVGDALIASHGAQTAIGHELGSGPIRAHEPVIVDLWPKDPRSACFADMTRTFVVGDPPAELSRYHRLTREALERSLAAIAPGAAGRELHRIACDVYEAEGFPTQLSKAPGEVLENGFFHSLGHGVGLEVHEAPLLGRSPDVLAAGDVVTLEPGCYRQGFGGCRLEDLVLVTDDGGELLTSYPYGLTP
jgi:Xaa-Pro aminopeptidase